MKPKSPKRAFLTRVVAALLSTCCALVAACDRAPGGKAAVKNEIKELEPRVVVPAAADVVSIRLQADEGFMGGPLDETIADAAVIRAIMKIVSAIQSGPRQVGDVHTIPKKGQLTINTKTGRPLELKLSDSRAIHFVSAYSMNTEGIAEMMQQYRKAKK